MVKIKVFSIMHIRMEFSNTLWSYILKHIFLIIFSGGFIFFNGLELITSNLMSIHSFCLSVRRLLPPILSFSLLKLLITTPTKRLSKKNDPTMMKIMKNRAQYGFILSIITSSISVAAMAEYIILDHPVVVDI